MQGTNKVILLGTLGADPELRVLPSGDAVCNMSVATNKAWQDKQTKEMKKRTEWHKVVAYKRLAENVSAYLKKGSKVYLEGELQTRSYETGDGIKKYSTEIIMQNITFIESIEKPSNQPVNNNVNYATAAGEDEFSDDIPF